MTQWKLPFTLVDGWRDRSRSSGGFEDPGPLGVVCHHTASVASVASDINFCINTSDDAPVGNGLFDRNGIFNFHTAGAANTQGRGGPVLMSSGFVPLDSGNSRLIAIEGANSGIGEEWNAIQADLYPQLVACMGDMIKREWGLDFSPNCCISHQEWAPTRKNDAAGPTAGQPWGRPGATTWAMDDFRGVLFRRMIDGPPKPPEPPPIPDLEEDMIWRVAKQLHDGPWFIGDGKTAYTVGDGGHDVSTIEAKIRMAPGAVNVVRQIIEDSTLPGAGPEIVTDFSQIRRPIQRKYIRQYVGENKALLGGD